MNLAQRAAVIAVGAVGLTIACFEGWSFYEQEFSLPPGQHCDVLERLDVSTAGATASADARRGVRRLLAVQEYAVKLPGLAEQHGDLLPANYRVEVLPCTTDNLRSRWHETLNDRAAAYAAAYNEAALRQPGAVEPRFDLAHAPWPPAAWRGP